jgi:hypothetical protein
MLVYYNRSGGYMSERLIEGRELRVESEVREEKIIEKVIERKETSLCTDLFPDDHQ